MQLQTDLIGRAIAHNAAYDLRYGESWEQALASAISSQGLHAYRPRQLFQPPRTDVTGFSAQRHLWAKFKDVSYLRPYQLDVVVKAGRSRYNLEVKALCTAAFRASLIHFGKVQKWDAKRLYGEAPVTIHQYKAGATPAVPVHAIALINTGTGEAWLCPSDKRLWSVEPSLAGNETRDYAIAPALLTPLQLWIDDLKALHSIGQS